jgi:hypothetical protein
MTTRDDLLTYLQEGMSRDMEHYVSSGRRFKDLSDQALEAQWVKSLKEFAATNGRAHNRENRELMFEMEIRGFTPSFEGLDEVFERMRQNGLKDSARLRADPELFDAADTKLRRDVEAVVKDVSKKPKH